MSAQKNRGPFDHAPPTIKPRIRSRKVLPIVVIAGDNAIHEDGTVRYAPDLALNLHEYPPTLFVSRSAADFIARLDAHYAIADPTHWQWQVADSTRGIQRPDRLKVATRVETAVRLFGFKGGSYHKAIDPVTMYGHGLDTIWPGTTPSAVRLMEWAVALRDFCAANGLDVKPTIGSISSQLLRDQRFYPKARRKVPAIINERAREHLPGNHYVLTTIPSPHREFNALYLDQSRAHHYHAANTPMPASDHLYAHGYFVTLDRIAFMEPLLGFHGLYCLDLEAPSCTGRFQWLPSGDLERAFVFSNELAHLADDGYRVTGVRAAWGSFQRDTGIPLYARWASEQLDRYNGAPWLKPILLATYGTLASRPRMAESVFRLAKRGTPVSVSTGRGELHGTLVQRKRKLEPGIANVIQRGMVEAATRSESVGYAQYLQSSGLKVLSIYADAVIVVDDADTPVPENIPEPWRLKTKLTHLQFINQQAFISGEMTKLPGVSRGAVAYRQHSNMAPKRKMHNIMTDKMQSTGRRI